MTGVSIGIEARGTEARGIETSTRVLGLGNEILGDDALGILVARQVQARFGEAVEVVSSSQSGFHVMDEMLGVSRLLVVDSIRTGAAKPGTVKCWTSTRLAPCPASRPTPWAYLKCWRWRAGSACPRRRNASSSRWRRPTAPPSAAA